MRTIHKYPLYVGKNIECWLPAGARILTIGYQGQALCLWAEIDDSAPFERRVFSVFGTGHLMPDNVPLAFIDTVFEGPYVWHIYEQT